MTNLLITTEQRDALVQYLQTRPYMEVYQALPLLMSLQEAPEPAPEPEKEPKPEPKLEPKPKPKK